MVVLTCVAMAALVTMLPWCAGMAYLGRTAIPQRERLPLRELGWRDVLAYLLLGSSEVRGVRVPTSDEAHLTNVDLRLLRR